MKTPRIPRSFFLVPVLAILLIITAIAGCSIHDTGYTRAGPSIAPSYGPNDGRLGIHFIDVGQGDSTLIQYNGTTILIDAGEADAAPALVEYLKQHDVRTIDLLIATHPHSDHIGGMRAVLDSFTVRKVMDSGMPHTTSTYRNFIQAVENKKIPYLVPKIGDTFSLVPGLDFLVLNAPTDSTEDADLNDNSLVLRATYGRINILFAGDIGTSTESNILRSGLPVESQLLKVAHHGSSHGTSREFLEAVRPEAAFILVGADNPYNYPSEKTLGRLEDRGTLIFRTDKNGTIVVRTDGMEYSIETERQGLYPFIAGSPVATVS